MTLKALRLAGLATVLCAVAAWPAGAAVRSNSASFTDAAGDSGNAPDITAIAASNNDNGQITFQITIGNRAALAAQDYLFVPLDTDGNAGNGVHGFDYALGIDISGAVLLTSASGSFAQTPAPTLRSSYATGVETVSINRSDIGNPSGLTFWVGASGDDGNTMGDDAPDGSGVYPYQITVASPTPGTTPPSSGSPTPAAPAGPLTLSVLKISSPQAKAGKPFVVALAVIRNDSGQPLNGGQLSCRAKLNGAALRLKSSLGPSAGAAACGWQIPQNARGKRLSGSITVSYQGVHVAKSFSAVVQ